jgi:hypothetical protein
MKYQLVLQFRAQHVDDFDDLVVLENRLIENLAPDSMVDSHDFGSGEFNIFILTDEPREAFGVVEDIIRRYHPQRSLKAAYRESCADEFIVVWPPNLRAFEVR